MKLRVLVTVPVALIVIVSLILEPRPPATAAPPEVMTVAPPGAVLAPDGPIEAATLGVATAVDDPSGVALRHFHEALSATARDQDKTRIAVFGASHVAGDVFTRVMRYQLKQRYGDAGIGFVVPAKPWRDYYNRDANLSYSDGWESNWVSKTRAHPDGLYGLAGVSFTSESKHDWVKVKTAKRSPFGKNVSDVEVFYWSQPGGGDFAVFVDGRWKKRIRTKSKEAGPGYATIALPDGPHTIKLSPRGNGPVTLFGMALDRDVNGVVMDSMGINGARLSDQLDWNPKVFADHLARREPDLVVLAYGTNATGDDDDPIARYERRLDKAVGRVKALLPKASCMLVGPSDRPVKLEVVAEDGVAAMNFLARPRQGQVIDVQRRVAHRFGCGFWDWNAAMGGDLSMLRWTHAQPRMGARDYIHLTRAGYERIGSLFMDAVMGSAGEKAAQAPVTDIETTTP